MSLSWICLTRYGRKKIYEPNCSVSVKSSVCRFGGIGVVPACLRNGRAARALQRIIGTAKVHRDRGTGGTVSADRSGLQPAPFDQGGRLFSSAGLGKCPAL